ncbi:MAG: Hsp70 family protein, partial [Clostridia bacterium]
YLVSEFKKTSGLDLTNDKMAMQRLKEASEKAKIELSSTLKTNINLPFITADSTGPKHLDIDLTRAKYDELTKSLLDKTVEPMKIAMKDAGVTNNDINRVILVGGSTRGPAVVELVKNFCGKEPYKGINPDECVAIGAAIQGGVLGGEVKDVLLLDVTPLSLGIETLGGVTTKLITRNTTIPASKSQVFSTAADNQTSVDIHVLQGEREMASDNKTLGNFTLTGIAPAPRGIPQIEVKFDIDANGIVHVTAKDLGTQKETSVTITSSTNLSEADVDKAVKDAEKYAEEDKKRKEEVEVKNGLDQLLLSIETFIRESGDKLEPADKTQLEEDVKKGKEVLEKGTSEEIKAETDRIAKSNAEIFQRFYQKNAPKQEEGAGEQPKHEDAPHDDDIKDA